MTKTHHDSTTPTAGDDAEQVTPAGTGLFDLRASALADGVIDAMTTDDIILAGYANQPAYQGKFKLVGDTFSKERYGVGLKKGDTETCKKVNDAVKSMIDDGSWKKALEDNLGSSYKFNASENPPKQDACS